MLRIEKVVLQGFKSFCDPTEVVFDPEGITAVVGPNGCGKSNVADALNWVIGEQRAKALRGGKMEDVIFQGSRNRSPAGMAEVLLILRVSEAFEIRAEEKHREEAPDLASQDLISAENNAALAAQPAEEPYSIPEEKESRKIKNKTRTIPRLTTKQYETGDRITIARRLYRTGESEYEMNGRNCRLRDIQDLFAGTGLGASHYAIIEQGRIGQVLSAKPLDRRSLIEEAAGISKFKMRQRSAELKLEAARLNLSRISDIIAEVERQQSSLKRQAAKARRFQKLKEESRGLVKWVMVTDYQNYTAELSALQQIRQQSINLESELIYQIESCESLKADKNSTLASLQSRIREAHEAVSHLSLQIEKNKQQQVYIHEQLNSLEIRAEASLRDRLTITERESLMGTEQVRLQDELSTLESEIDVEATVLAQAEAEHLSLSTIERNSEAELEGIQSKLREFATLCERWRQLMIQFKDTSEKAHHRIQGLETEKGRASEQKEASELEAAILREKLLELNRQAGIAFSTLNNLESELANLKALRKEREISLADLKNSLIESQQRIRSLIELDENKSYFSGAVQAITREVKNNNGLAPFRVLGTLADFIAANPRQEKMIDIAFRDEMQYLLVQSFDDAIKAIEFLKDKNLGRATFLVLDNGQPPPLNGKHDGIYNSDGLSVIRLVDLLGLDPKIQSLIRRALPFISEIAVTPELSEAIELSIKSNGNGIPLLTHSGELVRAGHLISGGSALDSGTGILALKREIRELNEKIRKLNDEINTITSSIEQADTDIEIARTRYYSLEATVRQMEKDITITTGLGDQAEREIERALTHLKVIESEINIATQELSDSLAKHQHAQSELISCEQQFSQFEQESSLTQRKVAELRQNSQERSWELSRRRADFAAKSERRKALQNNIRRLENDLEDLSRRLAQSQMEALEAGTYRDNLQTQLTDLKAALAGLEARLVEAKQVSDRLQQTLGKEQETFNDCESQLKILRDSLTTNREERSKLDIAKTKIEVALDHLAHQCQIELGEKLEYLASKISQSASESQTTEASPFITIVGDLESDNLGMEDDDLEPTDEITYDRLPDNFEAESAKLRLAELKSKIDQLGPVNLLALQELGELHERSTFLLGQKFDIETAIHDTISVINEIKNRSREKFIEAFNQINRNFSEMFIELFGGGHGEMRLIDESDVLESGIDIIAQPPGKRLQNVLLLSGGEKAMAALALIMGIFKYRPSPFCLLDEVDAPLDDVNIGRFADKILEMSNQTQFMVITHSKRTMEAARALYGVTMEDPGVSKLISVRLT